MNDWQRFVLAHGRKAHIHELAAVIGQPAKEILKLRNTGACARLKKIKRFTELFALWHGRPPRDNEWPAPRKSHRGSYNWQAPELALLASLVGRLGKAQISQILTKRLRKLSGDRKAERSPNSIQMAINHRLGMVTTDVVGGITIAEAGREINTRAVVYQAIRQGSLKPFRVGRLWVIPREKWEAWKATRAFPPKGYVQLSRLRGPFGIRSDKLSEWARMGYIPTAIRCNPFGMDLKQTRFGTWFIDPKVAKKLIADRRAGRPMPWWGKPEPGNLKITWKLLEQRRHPDTCRTCAQIWGRKGSPVKFEDYMKRYPPLAHGAKRHLTRPWDPGLSPTEVARHCRRSYSAVLSAILNGILPSIRRGGRWFVTRTEATRWKSRKCPMGGAVKSWISLETATKQYFFTPAQLRRHIGNGKLRSKVGTNGPMRGITYVMRVQCARLRESEGFTEKQAAKRVGVSIARLRTLLRGVNWRGASGIPLDIVNAVIKRYQSQQGYTLQEAAAELEMPLQWVHERKLDGTIRVMRAKWDARRLYVTAEMFRRLEAAKRSGVKKERFTADWLFLSKAATDAGVSTATLNKWALAGEIRRRESASGWRYLRSSVRRRARKFWITARFKRAVAPAWMRAASNSSMYDERIAA